MDGWMEQNRFMLEQWDLGAWFPNSHHRRIAAQNTCALAKFYSLKTCKTYISQLFGSVRPACQIWTCDLSDGQTGPGRPRKRRPAQYSLGKASALPPPLWELWLKHILAMGPPGYTLFRNASCEYSGIIVSV